MRAGREGNAKGQDRGSGSPRGHVTCDLTHDQACDVTHNVCGEASPP